MSSSAPRVSKRSARRVRRLTHTADAGLKIARISSEEDRVTLAFYRQVCRLVLYRQLPLAAGARLTPWRSAHSLDLLGIHLTLPQRAAFGYLEDRGLTFLVDFGVDDAVEKAESLGMGWGRWAEPADGRRTSLIYARGKAELIPTDATGNEQTPAMSAFEVT